MNLNYDDYSNQVADKVFSALGAKPWFRGVCMDTVKASYQAGKSIDEAFERAQMDTEYYDGPGF